VPADLPVPPRVRYKQIMPALVSVLVYALVGPDVAAAPLPAAADNDAIYAAIVAGDPTLTQPPAPLDSLVAATEIAEEKLRRADDTDDAEDLLMLAVQGRRAAYGRTSDALHLCRLVAALDHVLARETTTPRLVGVASDFRQEAERDRGTRPCGEAEPTSTSTPPTAPTPGPPPRPVDRPERPMQTLTPAPEPPSRPVVRTDRRRLRAGVGTLVPGLAMLAPMAALLALRVDARRDLGALNAATATRPATDLEIRQAADLHDRFTMTTAAATALGVTGGALVVTGAVLFATRGRQPRAALAPWGGRGVGGIVLQGRF
jgi:hypothetical protein